MSLKIREYEQNQIDFRIDSNTVIYVPTRKLAKKICKLLNNLGAKWWFGNRYTEDDNWDFYKENTCYDVHGGVYGDFKCYIAEKGFSFIRAEDFLKLHENQNYSRGKFYKQQLINK